MTEIRKLRADEIECRILKIREDGCSLLLYKDARVDMKLLDEIYGVDGWKREHEVINNNLFCTISIWSENKKQWIKKQDVGTESYAEKEKGQASDAFKRASTNVGIGRELYTAPFIWIVLNQGETGNNKGKTQLDYNVNFEVSEIDYDQEGRINLLKIIDQNGMERYKFPKTYSNKNTVKKSENTNKKQANNETPKTNNNNRKLTEQHLNRLFELGQQVGKTEQQTKNYVVRQIKDNFESMTYEQCEEICNNLQNQIKK